MAALTETTTTRVELWYPGSFVSESESRVVTERDPAHIAALYPRAYAFQFYDLTSAEVVVDGKKRTVSGERKNVSPTYYPGGRILTADDIAQRDPREFSTLLANMRGNGWEHVVQTRVGNFQPFDEAKDEVL